MGGTTYEMFPSAGFTVTHFLVSADIKKAVDFYSRVLGGKVVKDGENGKPHVVQLANTWIIINVGGGRQTTSRPAIYLAPPRDGEAVSSFMNIRVANIAECYERWKGLGAEFLTEPKGHEAETRCYIRDPDGHLIEVGEAKK
jgi:catechol 2,3-dioxygenase-like lactoylglutathione lyase family enzyme